MARPTADGIIVLNKPAGSTSMDMVRLVKRATRVKRVGHAGTLDPIAIGVLPICLGQATRLMEYMVEGRKQYVAELTLGSATDTQDSTGEVIATGDPSQVTREQVEATLPDFVGLVKQQPPMYSALKHEGKRLYELARAGVEVERPERDVFVYDLRLLDWSPPKVTIEVECGRGFYMRTFAHDLGAALGSQAHLSALTRARSSGFSIDETITPEDLEAHAEGEAWRELLRSPDTALLEMGAIALEAAAERHVRNGQAVALPLVSVYAKHAETRRAYSADGRFIGILRFNRPNGQWQPEKVFATPVTSRYAPAG